MDILKSPKLRKAEIYRDIFSGNAFLNPMTETIISLKHKLSGLYQHTNNDILRFKIKTLIMTLEDFKVHTDDISGANMKSTKRIYEIIDLVSYHIEHFGCDHNPYKSCMSSILDVDGLKEHFNELENMIANYADECSLQDRISVVDHEIKEHIQSDKLAFANLKQERLLCSISESLCRVVTNTKANLTMNAT